MPTSVWREVPVGSHNDDRTTAEATAPNTQQSTPSTHPSSANNTIVNPYARARTMGGRSQNRKGSIQASREAGSKRKQSSSKDKDEGDYEGPCKQCIAIDEYKAGKRVTKPHRKHKNGCSESRPRASKKLKGQMSLFESLSNSINRVTSLFAQKANEDDDDENGFLFLQACLLAGFAGSFFLAWRWL